MSDKNQYLAQDAAVIASPITYTATGGNMTPTAAVARLQANTQLLIDMISYEGTDATVKRYFLDEMSPTARAVLYKTLTDLKASMAVFTAV